MKMFWFVVTLSIWQISCANQLDSGAEKAPLFQVERRVNLSAMNFIQLSSGATVNLGSYMDEQSLDYVLLLWGSEGCGVCKEKSLSLKEKYIGQHPLLLNSQEERFEMIGINTDTGRLKQSFMFVWQDESRREKAGYDYIQWHDPEGKVGMSEVVGAKVLSVPITAMIHRDGRLLLSYNAQQPYELATLFSEMQELIGTKPVSPSRETLLGVETADRLRSVKVASCEDKTLSLQTVFEGAKKQIVQIAKAECDEVCLANHQKLMAAIENASSTCVGCKAATLAAKQPVDCPKQFFVGGAEFFAPDANFDTLVSWNTIPEYSPEIFSLGPLPPVLGPLTVSFDASDGRILFAHSGELSDTSIAEALSASSRAKVASFRLLGDRGLVDFTEVLNTHRYTVLSMMDSSCGGCIEILKAWQEPNGLNTWCQENGDFCQHKILKLYVNDAEHFENERQEEVANLEALGLTGYEVFLDTEFHAPEFEGTAMGPFSRFSEAYLKSYNKGEIYPWFFIFDRDGRIVFEVRDKEGNEKAVETFLKNQFQYLKGR